MTVGPGEVTDCTLARVITSPAPPSPPTHRVLHSIDEYHAGFPQQSMRQYEHEEGIHCSLYMSRRSNPHITEFSAFVRQRRQELGLSMRELESRSGIHNSRISRWEQGIEMPDRVDVLRSLARGLAVPLADLYAVAGIDIPEILPSHRPYLRSKYGTTLPEEALDRIADYADRVAAQYGVATGPRPGEDEQLPHTSSQPL